MSEFRPYRRIAALVRFDAFDAPVVGKALLLARQNGAELDLLHLIEPDGLLDGGPVAGEARAYEQAAERRLERLAAALGADGAGCCAFYGPGRRRLRQYAESRRPDLIVTGESDARLTDGCDVLILAPCGARRGRRLWAGVRNWLGAHIAIGV
jgi:hypothetical protein